VPPVAWHPEGQAKLWRYNLHYFDYLLNSAIETARRVAWVEDWQGNNPPPVEDAWEPYPTSLRIVNWLKFLSMNSLEREREEGWLRSLYQQASWLERNVEYHLRANHLLKNGKALLFAGACFEDRAGRRWAQTGLKLLREAFDEQVLDDGGHFERSPMYHCIVLEDFLDVVNVLEAQPGLGRPDDLECAREVAQRGLAFLERILLPGDRLPLFNDAAYGIAPAPAALRDYTERVIGEIPVRPDRRGVWHEAMRDSGYFLLGRGSDALVIDCGEIGPEYQPGHAHCDTLSIELVLNGRPIITDTGVGSYQPVSERPVVRGTAGHNTVMLDGVEQSEIWGGFRVGRRARPLAAEIKADGGGLRFIGAHDGYRHLRGAPVHEREIRFDGEAGWTILDRLSGKGEHDVSLAWHFAPDIAVRQTEEGIDLLDSGSEARLALVTVPAELGCRVESSPYYPEFGRTLSRPCVRLWARLQLPVELVTTIRRL